MFRKCFKMCIANGRLYIFFMFKLKDVEKFIISFFVMINKKIENAIIFIL